jgi:hypothetical protein
MTTVGISGCTFTGIGKLKDQDQIRKVVAGTAHAIHYELVPDSWKGISGKKVGRRKDLLNIEVSSFWRIR